jgi:hypothetical protein
MRISPGNRRLIKYRNSSKLARPIRNGRCHESPTSISEIALSGRKSLCGRFSGFSDSLHNQNVHSLTVLSYLGAYACDFPSANRSLSVSDYSLYFYSTFDAGKTAYHVTPNLNLISIHLYSYPLVFLFLLLSFLFFYNFFFPFFFPPFFFFFFFFSSQCLNAGIALSGASDLAVSKGSREACHERPGMDARHPCPETNSQNLSTHPKPPGDPKTFLLK